MKKGIFSILGLIISLCCSASDWNSHFSYEKDISHVERLGKMVYALSDGKLFSYNTLTAEYSIPLKERLNLPILKIASDEVSNKLLIVRDGSEIDIFDGENYTSIPALRNANLSFDKTIYDINIVDGLAYLSASFGFLVIDMQKNELREACFFMFPIYSVTKLEGNLYAATSKGVYKISVDKNIQDFQEWESYPLDEKYSNSDWTTFTDEEIRKLTVFDNRLYFLVPSRSLYHLQSEVVKRNTEISDTPTNLQVKKNKMYVYSNSRLWIYSKEIALPTSVDITSLTSVASDENAGEYWVGLSGKNLSKISVSGSSYSFILQNLKPTGPLSNYPFYMAYTGGKVRVVGGGYYGDVFYTPGQLSELNSREWYNYPLPSTGTVLDYACVAANPVDPSNIFVPSWGRGVYEFKDNSFVKLHDSSNSSLRSIFTWGAYIRVNSLTFEGPDKFWVCNTMVSTVVNLFQKENGIWKSYGYNYPEIYRPYNGSEPSVISDLLVDSKGNKWVVSRSNPYIFIFNENGTPKDTSDDKRRLFTKFEDQEGQSIYMSEISKIKEDSFGNIWLATNRGVFMVKPTGDIFVDDIVLNRLEFAGDVGEVSDQFLLRATSVNDMVIDKANRKWIATEGYGIYLINETDLDILAHFSTENSPLPSNRVVSITIDGNGHVFVGTDKGIVTYSGDLISTSPSDNNRVYAYPNPNSKEFARNTVIKSLKGESFVKIVDADNNLITSGFSTKDGSFEWNGMDMQGEKVLPAAYYLIGTSAEGLEGMQVTLRVIN